MTDIIDLQRLWNSNSQITSRQEQAAKALSIGSSMRLVSVIMVITHNDDQKLQHTFEWLLSQLFILEVIVIYRNDSVALIEPIEKFIQSSCRGYQVGVEKNVSLAAGYNMGAQYASGQYLLFIDADNSLPQELVVKLLETGIHKPMPWIVGIQPAKLSSLDTILSKITGYSATESDPSLSPEVSLPGGGRHVSAVAGECLFIPSETFIALRGIDQKCFHVNFHRDLCLRVHLAGGGVYQIENIAIQSHSHLPHSLFHTLRYEWQAFKGWCHFYRKYVGKLTNVFVAGLFYGLFSIYSLGRSVRVGVRYILFR